MPSLVYVADPMCSWCYGFGPELAAVSLDRPDLALEIVVGGLRAYTTQPLTAELKGKILQHWHHVAQASSLPFSPQALEADGFVYDTEPACRAVVAARLLVPRMPLLPLFSAIQQAFYAEGKNVTDGEVLAEIAALSLTESGIPTDAAEFHAVWAHADTRAATRADFETVQRWRIAGFPALLLRQQDRLHLVAAGYTQREELRKRIAAMLAAEG